MESHDFPLLKIRNLKTYFPVRAGVLKAVDGVDYSVNENETLGVVGESGSGKSVAALSILRLIPSPGQIAAGEILFKGEDLLRLPLKRMPDIRGKEISMIFQEPMSSLNPVFSVGKQILESVTAHRKVTSSDARKIVIEMLHQVGIAEPEKRLKEYPHQFSGGQRQRIMIAMALACRPNLLIADEPTTALDVTCQAQILELIKNLQQKQKTSVILITHDMGLVAETTDRVVVMYAGSLMESADVRTLFKDPAHPYTRALLKSIPYLGRKKTKTRLHEIPGTIPNLLDLPTGCKFHPRCSRAEIRCTQEEPPYKNIEEGHWARCWFT
jgi:oligopeptide/dipeptide ABC transporter ATP-binding protein